MKIGILTLPFNNNYGGYLQSYALMTVLKREGHDVELIYRRHNKILLSKKMLPALKNLVKRILGQSVISIIPDEEKAFRLQGEKMMPFLDKCISPKTKPLYSSKKFNEYIQGRYDVVIVGSDQVWRPDYGPGIRDYFFCGLPEDKPVRLSYAASFGSENPSFTEDEKVDCGKAIATFRAVSVREKSGLDIIKKYNWKLKTPPQVVLDPTLLLNREDYQHLLPQEYSQSKGKVFCYILDRNYEKSMIIDQIKEDIGKEEYTISDIQSGKSILPSIEDWLTAIRDSEFVITDSFHGMVFSVIFHKQFVVIPNMNRGSVRFVDFLDNLGLAGRIVRDVHSVTKQIKENIDFVECDRILDTKKTESLVFIKDNLI